jgi:ubiquinone/menaquinone biosynthesis C-methylase UbiE
MEPMSRPISETAVSTSSCTNQHQLTVDTYFKARARYWKEIYAKKDVYSVIHQQRRNIVLAMVDKLGLPPDDQVLEVGCGAGLTTAELACRGYRVDAVDSVAEMVDLTRRHAAETGVAERVKTVVADIHRLLFPNEHFSLVIVVGVLPWLEAIYEPIREVGRVTKAGGYLIVNMDNRWRLHELLDPRLNLVHTPIRKLARSLRHRNHLLQTQRCSPREFDAILHKAGYTKIHGTVLGFGPFTLLGKTVLPDSVGIKVHDVLQRYANRNFPLLRSTGAQYLVLARKQS